MARACLLIAVVLLASCAGKKPSIYAPHPGSGVFQVPGEDAPLYWDLRDGGKAKPILSVARNAGLYPGVPDTKIDLQCGKHGELSVGSLDVRIAADVGDRVKPIVSLAGGGIRLTGPDHWRSSGYELILNQLLLRPSSAELNSILAGQVCLMASYPDGSEGSSCFPAPPPAMAEAFLISCAAPSS